LGPSRGKIPRAFLDEFISAYGYFGALLFYSLATHAKAGKRTQNSAKYHKEK
jgi:hypothetical protein